MDRIRHERLKSKGSVGYRVTSRVFFQDAFLFAEISNLKILAF